MVKVIFKFDIEKDLKNHWHKSNWKSSWANFKINSKIKNICEGKKFKECKKELSHHLLKLQNSKIVLINIESVEKSWIIIEEEFFKRMERP